MGAANRMRLDPKTAGMSFCRFAFVSTLATSSEKKGVRDGPA
jgi:hypothetical protein